MITGVKEVYVGSEPDGSEWTFWTYMICQCRSGSRNRYHLIRVDNLTERMERLGCELPLGHCRRLIKGREPGYPKAGARKLYVRDIGD